jgi:hypothetical protein
MTINRTKAIEALERAYWREKFKEMSDAEIEAWISADLGLPGATFTDAQLLMIANHQRGE